MECRRLRAWAAALVVAGFVGVSCSTPTLPLPPPAALTVSPPDAEGQVLVVGEALGDAFVHCLNERTEQGVIVRADAEGAFSLSIEAVPRDTLTVYQQLGTDRGPSIQFPVPEAPAP